MIIGYCLMMKCILCTLLYMTLCVFYVCMLVCVSLYNVWWHDMHWNPTRGCTCTILWEYSIDTHPHIAITMRSCLESHYYANMPELETFTLIGTLPLNVNSPEMRACIYSRQLYKQFLSTNVFQCTCTKWDHALTLVVMSCNYVEVGYSSSRNHLFRHTWNETLCMLLVRTYVIHVVRLGW